MSTAPRQHQSCLVFLQFAARYDTLAAAIIYSRAHLPTSTKQKTPAVTRLDRYGLVACVSYPVKRTHILDTRGGIYHENLQGSQKHAEKKALEPRNTPTPAAGSGPGDTATNTSRWIRPTSSPWAENSRSEVTFEISEMNSKPDQISVRAAPRSARNGLLVDFGRGLGCIGCAGWGRVM